MDLVRYQIIFVDALASVLAENEVYDISNYTVGKVPRVHRRLSRFAVSVVSGCDVWSTQYIAIEDMKYVST